MDPTAVTVAVCTAVPPTLAALAAWRSSRRAAGSAAVAAEHVGETNGQGTVAVMLGTLVSGQVRTEQRLGGIESRIARLEEQPCEA